MSKVIITGGAGFIGSHLARTLITQGYQVHIIDNLRHRSAEHLPAEAVVHRLDIRQLKDMLPIFAGSELVFHLAAWPEVTFSLEHPLTTHNVNVNGTLKVLEAARRSGVRKVIFSSSASVYGEPTSLPLDEGLPARPGSPYALHKYIGERYMRLWSELYGLPTVSLRYFNVYGPGQNDEGGYALVVARFLKQRTAGESLTITGDGSQTRDFVHVSDVARANLLPAAESAPARGEAINIGSGSRTSINELAGLIGGERCYIEKRLEPSDSEADINRAQDLLGWRPEVSLKEGLDQLKAG